MNFTRKSLAVSLAIIAAFAMFLIGLLVGGGSRTTDWGFPTCRLVGPDGNGIVSVAFTGMNQQLPATDLYAAEVDSADGSSQTYTYAPVGGWRDEQGDPDLGQTIPLGFVGLDRSAVQVNILAVTTTPTVVERPLASCVGVIH